MRKIFSLLEENEPNSEESKDSNPNPDSQVKTDGVKKQDPNKRYEHLKSLLTKRRRLTDEATRLMQKMRYSEDIINRTLSSTEPRAESTGFLSEEVQNSYLNRDIACSLASDSVLRQELKEFQKELIKIEKDLDFTSWF